MNLKRAKELLRQGIEKIVSETGKTVSEVRENLVEMEKCLYSSDDEKINEDFVKLATKHGTNDMKLAFEHEIWRKYLHTKQVGIAIDISVAPDQSIIDSQFEYSISSKIDVHRDGSKYRFFILDTQEEQFEKELSIAVSKNKIDILDKKCTHFDSAKRN